MRCWSATCTRSAVMRSKPAAVFVRMWSAMSRPWAASYTSARLKLPRARSMSHSQAASSVNSG